MSHNYDSSRKDGNFVKYLKSTTEICHFICHKLSITIEFAELINANGNAFSRINMVFITQGMRFKWTRIAKLAV